MEQETVFWESVRDSDQITDVQAYLDQYPNGRFAALARNRIRRLRNATDTQPDKLEPSRMKLDLAFWQSIKGSQTSGDYEAYLVQFPNGQFARLARARIATAALELEETARFAREAAETKRAASKGTEGVALAPSIQDDNSQERKDTTNDRAIEAEDSRGLCFLSRGLEPGKFAEKKMSSRTSPSTKLTGCRCNPLPAVGPISISVAIMERSKVGSAAGAVNRVRGRSHFEETYLNRLSTGTPTKVSFSQICQG